MPGSLIDRRTAFWVLPLLVGQREVFAQTPSANPVVGVLSLGNEQYQARLVRALREGLQANGLVEGVNIRLELRYADSDENRLVPLAHELAAAGSRIIVTAGTTSVRATKTALPDMPIVMAGSADPVAMGFAQSLARPGGKITGISILGDELIGKRLELLKELVPAAKQFVALLQHANPGYDVFRKAFAQAARRLQVGIEIRQVATVAEAVEAISWAGQMPANGIYLVEDPVWGNAKAIFEAAIRQRLATMSGPLAFIRAGALAVYSLDSVGMNREIARYVAAILRGTPPGDIPIEQPTSFKFVLNLKTAKAIGLDVPALVLQRADEVIE